MLQQQAPPDVITVATNPLPEYQPSSTSTTQQTSQQLSSILTETITPEGITTQNGLLQTQPVTEIHILKTDATTEHHHHHHKDGEHHHHHHHHHHHDGELHHHHHHHGEHKHSKEVPSPLKTSREATGIPYEPQPTSEVRTVTHLDVELLPSEPIPSQTSIPEITTTTQSPLTMPSTSSESPIVVESAQSRLEQDQAQQSTMPSLAPPASFVADPSPSNFASSSTPPITSLQNQYEIKSDDESDQPERQPGKGTPSTKWRFSTVLEPPMPLEHKKDRLRHHIRLAHKKNILGETIYKGHASWLLMRDIQTGLFTNIRNMANRKADLDLFHTPPVTVHPISPDSTFTFKFKDYCPMAFYNLRERFGINHVDYVTSLCQNWNEVGTPGKSGSLFFFSLDNQYVLKTIPKREAKILRELLPSYYQHMMTHPNSLLTRFMGLHRVKPHKGRQVRFLVMGNLFNSNLRIHVRFDLKGSTIGRELSPAEREKKNPTFKDLDFRRLNKKLHLGPTRDMMLKQLQEDSDYLSSQHIMDYSLLVGIHFMQQEDDNASDDEDADDEPRTPPLNKSSATLPPYVPDTEVLPVKTTLSIFETEEGGIRAKSPDGTPLDEFYYIGVIDILMHYSMRKQVEHAAKRILHPRGEISAVDPSSFAKRFMKFAVDIFD